MNISDQFLLRLLAGSPPLSAVEARGVQRWWQEDRSDDEGLTAFLIRNDVLSQEAVHLIEWMRRGWLTFTDAQHLFASNGVNRARAWLRASLKPLQASFGARCATEEPDRALLTTERRPVVRPADGPSPRGPASQGGNAPILQSGTLLGKCLLTARIARGSTGVVFKAYHQSLNLTVAIKALDTEAVENDPGLREQFCLEARLLAQLDHPHVVKVLYFDDTGPMPYLVLECIEGLTLSELIQQSGRLRCDKAARMALEVARGLEAAHKLDIVHRDVKPANILITRDGKAKLADLGLAIVGERMNGRMPSPSGADGMAGTVAYMPPEQALAPAAVDFRADIYALGATLYHALTGQMPFRGATRAEVLHKHATEMPLPPHQVVPGVDPALVPIVLKMLAKRPEERFQTYAELVDALAALEAQEGRSIACPSGSAFDLSVSPLESSVDRPRSFWRTLVARFKA